MCDDGSKGGQEEAPAAKCHGLFTQLLQQANGSTPLPSRPGVGKNGRSGRCASVDPGDRPSGLTSHQLCTSACAVVLVSKALCCSQPACALSANVECYEPVDGRPCDG